MKNIHILPTDKPSRLWVNNLLQGKLELSKEAMPYNTSQNIYITSDEEIKEGDWVKNISFKEPIFKVDAKGFTYVTLLPHLKFKKVVLTLDQDLIKDGVQAIDDEFLEWFVKNPSCEKVEVEKAPYDGTKSIDKYWGGEYKIIISKTTQQVINEDFAGGLDMGQIIPKEERSYSEEDMKLSFEAGKKRGNSGYHNTDNFRQPNFEEFIEQFKNK